MKFLFLFLISINAWAGFVAGSKINECSKIDYSSASACQEAESEACYKVPNDSGECGIFKLKNIHSGPMVAEESCSGQQECQDLLASKVCSVNHDAFISEDYSSVYCIEIVGKEMVIDQPVKAQKDAEKAAAAQIEAIIASGAKADADCKRVLHLIGGFNLLPGRSSEQAGEMIQTFAAAKAHLQDGRPGAAKAAIQAIPVDGVLVTQQMKDLALEQLKDW